MNKKNNKNSPFDKKKEAEEEEEEEKEGKKSVNCETMQSSLRRQMVTEETKGCWASVT